MRTTNIFHRFHFYCLTIVTKPNLEEFLRKLFEQYRIENCGKQLRNGKRAACNHGVMLSLIHI